MTNLTEKPDILSLFPEELTQFVRSIGEKDFRAKQLYGWMQKGAAIDEMTNLPAAFREKLKECSEYRLPKIEEKYVSQKDGTVKYLFSLIDGECVESVFMRYEHGNTICVSSQAGCRMGCKFCASTLRGKVRDLTASEILGQVIAAQRDTGERIGGVVMMGIGEPLDNYDNVLRFLELVHHPDGLNISHRHISLSTCGLVDKIDRLADEHLQITLSVSLHAPNDDIRRATMPVARKYPYETLIDACKRYTEKTSRRISFEYALISGVNDSDENAHQLGRTLSGMLCHVNLIPVNEVKERGYKKSTRQQVARFTEILNSYKINTTVRRKLGGDINASCGQLRAEHREE